MTSDAEIYRYVQRAYSPVMAIRVWEVLLTGGGFAASVRRSFQCEIARSKAA